MKRREFLYSSLQTLALTTGVAGLSATRAGAENGATPPLRRPTRDR